MKKLIILLILIIPLQINHQRKVIDQRNLKLQVLTQSPLTLNNLETYLKLQKVKHPNIVIKQAILETGWLTSEVCKRNNNLFGLVFNGKYAKFKHWTDCVKSYKYFQNKRYTSGCYYTFLVKRKYASDKNYIKKLKMISYGRT